MLDYFADLIFLCCALLFNWLIVGILVATKKDCPEWRRRFGAAFIALGLPLAVVFVIYLLQARELKTLVALGCVLLYIAVEFLLDYVFKIEFRQEPIRHVPYVLLEYLSLFSLIAIAFSIDRTWGWLVSLSFWAVLGSVIYIYAGARKPSAHSS